ncbi:MAG: hypothetical protein H0U75_13210 [Legionella sp.]|nr:hypothetical protein [Legionella sp.]
MTYYFNPHHHVKIWLSKDKDIFLNLENQVRLVKMRDINPEDEIHFIYDGALLSKTALIELQAFCGKYRITPQNVRSLMPHCKTVEEQNLCSLYAQEVSHLNEGGNLGVGSDILRWLSPIYTLGTYTDFDVPVDTSKLPNTITVAKPLLMSLGSVVSMGEV